MEDLATIHKIYKADEYLKPGSVALDLGACDGHFADWAESLGAKAYRIDIRGGHKILPIAVGKANQIVKIDGHGTGAHILYDGNYDPTKDTLIQCVTLQKLLDFIGRVDVIKCDIEGSEYEIFEGTDLSRVTYIAIEFHAWTEPAKPEVEGLGIRTGAMPENAVDRLISWLEKTHHVECNDDKNSGGYIFAKL